MSRLPTVRMVVTWGGGGGACDGGHVYDVDAMGKALGSCWWCEFLPPRPATVYRCGGGRPEAIAALILYPISDATMTLTPPRLTPTQHSNTARTHAHTLACNWRVTAYDAPRIYGAALHLEENLIWRAENISLPRSSRYYRCRLLFYIQALSLVDGGEPPYSRHNRIDYSTTFLSLLYILWFGFVVDRRYTT